VWTGKQTINVEDPKHGGPGNQRRLATTKGVGSGTPASELDQRGNQGKCEQKKKHLVHSISTLCDKGFRRYIKRGVQNDFLEIPTFSAGPAIKGGKWDGRGGEMSQLKVKTNILDSAPENRLGGGVLWS